jgi:hypothetical protein
MLAAISYQTLILLFTGSLSAELATELSSHSPTNYFTTCPITELLTVFSTSTPGLE